MKTRNEVIANAVITGLVVSGDFGANSYNVCDLMTLSLSTLDNLYRKNTALLAKQNESKSLFNKQQNNVLLEQTIELLETIFTIRKETQDLAETKAKELKAKQEKLALLKKAKEVKEIEAINSLNLEELDKQIAELS